MVNYYKIYKTANLLKQKSLTIGLAMAGFLIGLAFLLAPAKPSNYGALLDIANTTWWASVFFSYAIFKTTEIFYQVYTWLKVITTVLSTWLWFYFLLSLTIYDTQALAPTELLLVLPIVAELFELSYQFYCVRANRSLK